MTAEHAQPTDALTLSMNVYKELTQSMY